MCTVVIHVPESQDAPTHLLAVRDEDPQRPWRPLGEHWPTHPGVVGVQDIRAGGAWLAAQPTAGRLAVLLNVGPPGPMGPAPGAGLVSRGQVVLEAAAGTPQDPDQRTQPYLLVTIEAGRVELTLSDGSGLTRRRLDPGTHMLVNSEHPDDESFTRVRRWLPQFRQATTHARGDRRAFFDGWLEVIARSADLAPGQDAAIIRDNRPWGVPTQSLMMCLATVGTDTVSLDEVEFTTPGDWASCAWAHHLP